MMDLQTLIHKYWAGETSREEEKALRQALQDPQHAQAFPKETMLFAMYAEEAQQARAEPMKQAPGKKRSLRPLWLSIAAGIALLLGLYWGTPSQPKTPGIAMIQESRKIEDPDQAYALTKEALMMVSKQLNRSKKPHRQAKKLQLLTRWFPQELTKD